MKPLLLTFLISFCGMAFAQAPSGQEQPEAPQEEAAGEGPAASDRVQDAAPEAQQENPETGGAADAVEETLPPEPPEETDLAGDEFEPGEEISEDYPVPLPSDI